MASAGGDVAAYHSHRSLIFRIGGAVCLALLLTACASSPRNLILGKWQAESALKLTAEFRDDGTAVLTMFGQPIRGRYKVTNDSELVWTLNGITSKSKVKVSATELELTDDANQTIVYRRK